MRRLVVLAFAAFALASCSGANTVHLLPARELPPDLYGKGTQAAGGRTQQVTVYFVRGKKLEAVNRSGPSSSLDTEVTMDQLLRGPTPEEKADGLTSAIPDNTELLSVRVAAGIASVNLSQQFERAADEETQQLRLAQIVYSISDLPEVDSVHFFIEGDSQTFLDENGRPAMVMSPSRFSRYAPEEVATQINPCSLVEALGQCQQESPAPETSAPDVAP